jgi:hypothetical protein
MNRKKIFEDETIDVYEGTEADKAGAVMSFDDENLLYSIVTAAITPTHWPMKVLKVLSTRCVLTNRLTTRLVLERERPADVPASEFPEKRVYEMAAFSNPTTFERRLAEFLARVVRARFVVETSVRRTDFRDCRTLDDCLRRLGMDEAAIAEFHKRKENRR